jgi:hypothetical protein
MLSSSTLLEQDRDLIVTYTGADSDMVHQLIYVRLCDAFRASVMVWSCSARCVTRICLA